MAKLPSGCKPSKALSKDSTRPILGQAYIVERDDGLELQATDSYKAVFLPITSSTKGDVTPGPISATALKAVEKSYGRSNMLNGEFIANGDVQVPAGGLTLTRSDSPDVDGPNLDAIEGSIGPIVFEVGINAAFLADVAAALGDTRNGKDPLVLGFQPGDGTDQGKPTGLKAISVRLGNKPGRAILMPVRVEKQSTSD